MVNHYHKPNSSRCQQLQVAMDIISSHNNKQCINNKLNNQWHQHKCNNNSQINGLPKHSKCGMHQLRNKLHQLLVITLLPLIGTKLATNGVKHNRHSNNGLLRMHNNNHNLLNKIKLIRTVPRCKIKCIKTINSKLRINNIKHKFNQVNLNNNINLKCNNNIQCKGSCIINHKEDRCNKHNMP